jgi:hypothetical protein
MRFLIASFIGASLLGLASASAAFSSKDPATGLPTADNYSAAVLPEREGIVAWRLLADAKPEMVGIRVIFRFSDAILRLDRTTVRLQGFMIPLVVGERQTRFLLSAVPPACPFCLPAGPEALVEVLAKQPVRFGVEPIVVTGRFAVLKDEDEGGLYYRLMDAEAIGPAVHAPAKASMGKLRN